jgi:hypothetical protein
LQEDITHKSIKMALNKNRHLLESYLDSSDEDEDDDDDDSEEDKDQPMSENSIPLLKRQPLEGKHIPVLQTPSKRDSQANLSSNHHGIH